MAMKSKSFVSALYKDDAVRIGANDKELLNGITKSGSCPIIHTLWPTIPFAFKQIAMILPNG